MTNDVADLLECDSTTLKQMLYLLTSVETSDIADGNTNNSIADILTEFMYSKLSDVSVRNSTYLKFNKLLSLNYALNSVLSSKVNVKTSKYTFGGIETFINNELDEESSLKTISSLMTRTEDIDSWMNYLGYDAKHTKLFEDHDRKIDNVFNLTFNEIKKVFPEYANVYSNAISKALNTSHLKRTLFKYENAIALLLSNSTYKYKVNDDKCRTEIIDYMYYYLGFSVIKYDKKGNIEFDYSSGFVNGDVGEFLTNLELDNKRKKFPIYTLINMLNTYVFIDDGTNSKKSFFDSFIKDVVGSGLDCIKIVESDSKAILSTIRKNKVNGVNVFKLATLENAIGVKKLIEADNYTIPKGVTKQSLLNRVNSIIEQCVDNLESHTFFNRFGDRNFI